MNDNYPPLPLMTPTIEDRRGERPRPVPLSAEVIARRGEIAQRLKRQIDPISQRLTALTDEQRRAVFLKLEHDAPVQLTGTGLRAITEPAAGITLASRDKRIYHVFHRSSMNSQRQRPETTLFHIPASQTYSRLWRVTHGIA